MTDDKIDYAIKVMNEKGIALSGDALKLRHRRDDRCPLGSASTIRWPMAGASQGRRSKKAYTLEFVNKGVGKA